MIPNCYISDFVTVDGPVTVPLTDQATCLLGLGDILSVTCPIFITNPLSPPSKEFASELRPEQTNLDTSSTLLCCFLRVQSSL